jgi:hypothetical protein
LQTAGKSVLEKIDIMKENTKLLPFLKEIKAMCDALSSSLEADDLAAWIVIGMEAPVMHLL